MSPLSLRWLPLVLLGLVAGWLRTHDLAVRPMHSDEANQAVKSGELLQSGRYAYDARDHHGPTLYYAVLPVAFARGQHQLAELDETTVRLVPALAGTVAVLLLVMVAAPLGPWPALAAGAFLAVAPPAVYYSRYFIQETLLVAFTLASLAGVAQWWRSGRVGWAVVAGISFGLMFATKATAPIFVFASALGLAFARPERPASQHVIRDSALALVAAGICAALFFSSFGSNVSGLRDALAAYGFGTHRAAAGSGHEKPWWYYFAMLGIERRGGLVWHQLGFAALAACGAALCLVWSRLPSARPLPREAATADAVAALMAQARARQLLRGTLVYLVVIAAVFSLIPYKTPWHLVHWLPPLAVLAAGALALLPRARMGLLFAALVVAMQLGQTRLAVFQRPADERNPYAYVHSSPDVLKLTTLAKAARTRSPDAPLRVIGDEYWPIPWYLRGISNVGYWFTAPDNCDGALVIASGSQIDVVRERLHGHYRETLLGLRPDVLCVVFTPQP